MSVGSKINDLREDHDLSRKRLAREVGISYALLVRVIRDESDIKASMLHDIAEYFGVSMDYFWE